MAPKVQTPVFSRPTSTPAASSTSPSGTYATVGPTTFVGADPRVVSSSSPAPGTYATVGPTILVGADPNWQGPTQSPTIRPREEAVKPTVQPGPVAVAAPPPGYSSSYKGPDTAGMQKKLEDIYTNRYLSELEKIRQARDTANQGYNNMATTATQNSYNQRNQSDVGNIQAAQRLKEMMANSGLSASGDNVTANVGLETARQSGLNAINQTEGNTLQDISQKRALLANQAAGQETSLQQQLNSDKAAQLFDLMKFGDERAFQTDNRDYGRFRDTVNDTFRSDQAAFDRQTALAQLTGELNGNQTLAARNADRQFGFQDKQANIGNALQLSQLMGGLYQPADSGAVLFGQTPIGRTIQGQQFDATEAQRTWDNTFKEGQFNFQKAQQLWENTFKDKSFDQSVKQFAQQLGVDYARLNQSQQQFVAEQAFKSKSQDLQQSQFDWTKDPNNPDNIYKISEANKNNTPASNKNVPIATYVKNIDKLDNAKRKNFFSQERGNIVNDFGLDGYTKLYNLYFDQYGNPKK